MIKNRDARWHAFDSAIYELHNYGILREDDAWILERMVEFHSGLPAGARVVDVGTGPNLMPLLVPLRRSQSIAVWEYSLSNISWLASTLLKGRLQHNWQQVWDRIRNLTEDHDSSPDVIDEMRSRIRLHQASIFDLPQGQWDVATMEFCAESITSNPDEFVAACVAFAGCIKDDGSVFAAFMEGSEGYTVGDVQYPAVRVDAARLQRVFAPLLVELDVARVPDGASRLRSGYTGMLVLTGKGRRRGGDGGREHD